MLRARSVRVVCIPITFHRLAKLLRFAIAVPVLLWMLLWYDIDTVQFNGYLESWLIPWVRLLGRRAVRTAHGPTEIDRYTWYGNPLSYLPRLGSLVCIRASSAVVCVSEAVYGDIASHVRSNILSTVPNWVQNSEAKRTGYAVSRVPSLLYVGRLETYKGLPLLLTAMRRLERPLRLVIVGDGSDRTAFEALTIGLDCSFEGFQEDVARYYQSCDLMVNPSLGPEGLPIVSLEAMASGIPCVFSDLPVHREISSGGEGAALFRSGDVDDLVRALDSLLASESLRRETASRAQAIIDQRYSPQAARRGYLQAFEIA